MTRRQPATGTPMSGGTGTTVQHHRQAAYDRGYEDGLMERAHWLPMGIGIGVAIGAAIVLIAQWVLS
jgi:thiamine pyrophosphate-dependent acetolactate synthase large subunit-like protein